MKYLFARPLTDQYPFSIKNILLAKETFRTLLVDGGSYDGLLPLEADLFMLGEDVVGGVIHVFV
jgi:hypothetical protein